jgi:hypothetical protein
VKRVFILGAGALVCAYGAVQCAVDAVRLAVAAADELAQQRAAEAVLRVREEPPKARPAYCPRCVRVQGPMMAGVPRCPAWHFATDARPEQQPPFPQAGGEA